MKHGHGQLRSISGIALVLCLAAASANLMAQLPTATILGVVKDTSGAVIAGAAVTARNTETGQTRNGISSEDGSYRFVALPVGSYEVRVELSGFATEVRRGLTLSVGQEAVINITLQVGATEQTVAVTAETPLVNTTTSSLGGLVDARKISELPLNGRNYIDLTLLQPGVTAHLTGPTSGSLSVNGTSFSSNGAPIRSNNYLLDGAPMATMYGTTSAAVTSSTLGVEGIREYRVVTNSFSAEYGGTMGSQVAIVSKGGSNRFSGSLFEYHRNAALDARNFFDYPTAGSTRRLPGFTRNNFGGAIGGPIKTDKTFFFGTYEGLREGKGITTISNVFAPECHGPSGAVLWNGAGTQPGGSIGPCPQLGSNPAGAGTNSVTIDSKIGPWLAIWPNPNLPNNQFAFVASQVTREDYGQARIDHVFSARDNAFARYTLDDADKSVPGAFVQFPSLFDSRSQFLTLAEDHNFSPALLNSARISFSRTKLGVQSPTGLIGPQYSFNAGREMGTVSVTGITPYGPFRNAPAKVKQNIFAYSDDLFYTWGRHALKFGVLANHYQQNPNSNSNPNGNISFSSVANFYRAIPTSMMSATPGSIIDRTLHFTTLGFYVQDDLRLTSRFTFNLGLRYEFSTELKETKGNGSNIRNIRTDTQATRGPIFLNPTKKNVSPRFGFAWDVAGNEKTAVRGAFGLLYDVVSWWGTAMIVTVNGTPPVSSSSLSNNPGSFTLPFVYQTLGRSASIVNYNIQQPHILQYNLAIEQALPFQMSLTAAYAGSRGINLAVYSEGNPNTPGIPNPATNGTTCVARPAEQAFDGKAPYCWPQGAPKLNPAWDSIVYIDGDSNSWYNSLQFNLQKRITKGLQFQNSYTFSKALDTTNGPSGADGSTFSTNPLDLRMDKGRAAYDVTHNWRFNALYHFPEFRSMGGVLGKIVNGWWTSGILTAQSGYPFSPTLGGTDRSRAAVNSSGVNRPNIVPGRNDKNITQGTSTGCGTQSATGVYIAPGTPLGTPDHWFDPCAFSIQNAGFLGNSARNSLTGPGIFNVDFSLNRDMPLAFLGETGKLQFRAEVFNILNHTNFGNPSTGVFSINATDAEVGLVKDPVATVGQIRTTRTASRQIQFALKVIF